MPSWLWPPTSLQQVRPAGTPGPEALELLWQRCEGCEWGVSLWVWCECVWGCVLCESEFVCMGVLCVGLSGLVV